MRRARPRPLQRLFSLSAPELVDLARAQIALVVAQLHVWTVPRGRLVTVGAEPDAPAFDARALVAAERLTRAVRRAAAHGLFRPKCLVQALGLRMLLERAGVRGLRIRVGVRRDAEGFAAHAWVELAGHPLGERPEVVRSLVPLSDARLAPTR